MERTTTLYLPPSEAIGFSPLLPGVSGSSLGGSHIGSLIDGWGVSPLSDRFSGSDGDHDATALAALLIAGMPQAEQEHGTGLLGEPDHSPELDPSTWPEFNETPFGL